jgi:hypothetical protein
MLAELYSDIVRKREGVGEYGMIRREGEIITSDYCVVRLPAGAC